MNELPTTGSPPMPTTVLWPMPMSASSLEIWYVSVPLRLTRPTRPGREHLGRHDPDRGHARG